MMPLGPCAPEMTPSHGIQHLLYIISVRKMFFFVVGGSLEFSTRFA